MKAGDLIFVYGTLRKGASNDLSKKPDAEHVGWDLISGKLFNVSWFPGVKNVPDKYAGKEGPNTIQGDVFRLKSESIIRALDSYEGYPSLYGRKQTTTATGETVWVYTYNMSVDGKQEITSGDWLHPFPAISSMQAEA